MLKVKFFQLVLIAGIFLLSACGQRNLSENTADSAQDADDLEVWDDLETITVNEQPSIWDITKRHGSFSTFSQLVEAAGLEETFQSDQPMTVLAPTDEAFDELPDGALEALLEVDNKSILVGLLLNHVIPEVYLSIDLLDGESTPTLSGNRLLVSKGEEITLSNATVTTADISASNGVVHVVDQVIVGE